jgi:hypothetical protein
MISYEDCLVRGERVLRLLETGKLMFGSYTGDRAEVIVISDPIVAELYATKQDPPIDPPPNWQGDDFTVWSDVIAAETSVFVEKERIPENKLNALLWELKITFPATLEAAFPTLREEVDTMGMWCIRNEIYGRPSNFFSRVWGVYEQGGLPCGWLGKYPEGALIALDPKVN